MPFYSSFQLRYLDTCVNQHKHSQHSLLTPGTTCPCSLMDSPHPSWLTQQSPTTTVPDSSHSLSSPNSYQQHSKVTLALGRGKENHTWVWLQTQQWAGARHLIWLPLLHSNKNHTETNTRIKPYSLGWLQYQQTDSRWTLALTVDPTQQQKSLRG